MFSAVVLTRDLRFLDNPALYYGCWVNHPLVVIYLIPKRYGAARSWWAEKSVIDLAQRLKAVGIPLVVAGNLSKAFQQIQAFGWGSLAHIFMNEWDDPEEDISFEKVSGPFSENPGFPLLYASLRQEKKPQAHTIACQSFFMRKPDIPGHSPGSGYIFYGNRLTEGVSFEALKKRYRVFTPFWKDTLAKAEQYGFVQPLGEPDFPPHHQGVSQEVLKESPWVGEPIFKDPLAFEQSEPAWWKKFDLYWHPGELEGRALWETFLQRGVTRYKTLRNTPSLPQGTSKMSPYLHHGEISVRQMWVDLKGKKSTFSLEVQKEIDSYMSELGWREFAYHQRLYCPDLAKKCLRPEYESFFSARPNPPSSWRKAWERGCTGFPLVDAGMRQLWHTGWMHNRVRMLTASIAVKNLGMDWREGEAWFFDTLVDADEAANPANWQWVAGCGTDSVPYFRIFNPMLQAKTHDPEGQYIQSWVKELQGLSPNHLEEPGLLSPNYPLPVVDFKKTRQHTLDLWETFRQTPSSS